MKEKELIKKKTNMQKKRIPPVFRLTIKKGVKLENIYTHPEIRKIVLEELVVAIKDGINQKKKSINLFQIADSDLILEVPRENWKKSLHNALQFYCEKDDSESYIKCAEIRDIINNI